MAEPSLSVRADHDGDTVTLLVTGEVDLATAPRLAAALDTALERPATGPRRVVVDLSGVGFLDSSGLRVLIDLAARLDPDGALTVVCPVGAPPRRAIELSGLTDRLGLTTNQAPVPLPRRP